MATLIMGDVIRRLEALLPSHEPELWESLQPPATDQELALLAEAVAPVELPSDWIDLLRWRNGGPWGGPWWPVLDSGHLIGTREAVEHYRWLRDNTEEWQWRRSWLPIAHEGWNQCGIEAVGDEGGLVVDACFPDPPTRLAPSLPALLHAVCATIEADISTRPDQFTGARYQSWLAQRSAIVQATYEEYAKWIPMTVHAHALLPVLRTKLEEHPRISVLLRADVHRVESEESIGFYWLDRQEQEAAETSVRTNSSLGLAPDEAAERIVGGLFT